jgi:hypothetical protein
VDPGLCWREGSVFYDFLNMFRICVLFRKAMRRRILENGIKFSPSSPLVVRLALPEGMWRCVSGESHWIWLVLLMMRASLHRQWLLLSCLDPLGLSTTISHLSTSTKSCPDFNEGGARTSSVARICQHPRPNIYYSTK